MRVYAVTAADIPMIYFKTHAAAFRHYDKCITEGVHKLLKCNLGIQAIEVHDES